MLVANNPTGPGWADPETGRFDDDAAFVGRDGRRYGPLPRSGAGTAACTTTATRVTIVLYASARTDVLESPGVVFVPRNHG